MDGAGTSLVSVGYFTCTADGGDEVSFKPLGGSHTDSDPDMGTIYDLGIKVTGKSPRMRAEGPHPDYTDTLQGAIVAEDGLSFIGSWRGMMAIIRQEANGVKIEWFQDQGDCETKPANQWVKVYEFFDDGTKISGIGNAAMFPLKNLNHAKNTAQNTWRIDETPGLKQKWLAIAEIDPN